MQWTIDGEKFSSWRGESFEFELISEYPDSGLLRESFSLASDVKTLPLSKALENDNEDFNDKDDSGSILIGAMASFLKSVEDGLEAEEFPIFIFFWAGIL